MGEDAAQLRRDIERTRDNMGYTLDAIEDRVSPSRIIERRRNRVMGGLNRVRDAVMGSAHDAGSTVSERASDFRETVTEGAAGVVDTVAHSPAMARRQAEGNPFAAGVIAFGAGLLAAALIPPTEPEREMANQVRRAAEPLMGPAQDAAHEIAATIQEHGQQAVQDLKESATSAAQAIKETATTSAQETKEAGQSAAQQVSNHTSS